MITVQTHDKQVILLIIYLTLLSVTANVHTPLHLLKSKTLVPRLQLEMFISGTWLKCERLSVSCGNSIPRPQRGKTSTQVHPVSSPFDFLHGHHKRCTCFTDIVWSTIPSLSGLRTAWRESVPKSRCSLTWTHHRHYGSVTHTHSWLSVIAGSVERWHLHVLSPPH